MEDMEGLKDKNILVTGGAGFIGSHLVSELLKQGFNVLVIDKEVKPKSIFALNHLEKDVILKIADIREKETVFNIVETFKPLYIFHIAAEPIVEFSFNDPYSTFQTNIMGTVHMLEAARRSSSVKGIIVASSDKAYGKTEKPYTEDAPLKGDHPYDVSKSSADLISQAYFKTYETPVVITRFGNVYGEGDIHLNRIIPSICEAIIKKKILKIRSDGTYVRDYIYVRDVVDGYMFLLKNINKIKGEAFNFSSSDMLSVLDVVRKAEEILNTKIPYKILNIAQNEIPYQHLIDRKVKKLGWRPRYSIKDILSQVLDWYKTIL